MKVITSTKAKHLREVPEPNPEVSWLEEQSVKISKVLLKGIVLEATKILNELKKAFVSSITDFFTVR